MSKAYYCYRPHPLFGKFYPGKTLNLVSDTEIIYKYLKNLSQIKLAKKFFPNGLSPHGLQILINRKMIESDIEEPITEIIFELVRQSDYPDAPSRLSSLYAADTIEHAKLWCNFWSKTFEGQPNQVMQNLWEIEFETNAKLCDAALLNSSVDDEFSYLAKLENAHRYWSGELTHNPMPELLIPYPVLVTRLIRDKDFPK